MSPTMTVEHPTIRALLAHIELMIRPSGSGAATYGSVDLEEAEQTGTERSIGLQLADGSLVNTYADSYT